MKWLVPIVLLVGCSGDSSTSEADGGVGLDASPLDASPPPDAAPPDASPSVLPVIFIQTGEDIPVDEKVDGTLSVVEEHDGSLTDIASRPRSFESHIGIEVRGNTSLMFPKHSFGVETRTPEGDDADMALLGFPAESDWVLFAPYNDKTLMRDRLAYDLGASLAPAKGWTPRTRYVEVYVNGEYQGVYLLIEKIKRGKWRVNIPKVAPDDSGDLSGGYIIKREGEGDGESWESARGTLWNHHYPKTDEITPAQEGYLRAHVDAFEDAMLGPGEFDYAAWIDVDSFVDYAIVSEVTRNIDGYRKSAYMYKKPSSEGGLFFMGPIWDFNLAFGNADYCEAWETTGFIYTRDLCEDLRQIPRWWPRLWADPAFAQRLRCRWDDLRQDELSEARVDAWIESYREQLRLAQPRDQEVWKTMGEYVWPNWFIGQSWDEEIGFMRGWLHERIAWLDTNLPGTCR